MTTKGISMNYQKHYNLLIERAKIRNLEGYKELHHIVPRCIGGTDERDNLVELTAEEHFVAHQLLVKMYPDHDGLKWAAVQMTGHQNGKRTNNKLYGWLKRQYQKICKQRVGKKNGSYGATWYHNPETLENRKFKKEESIPDGFVKGRKIKPPIFLQCRVCDETFESVRGSKKTTCSDRCSIMLMSQTRTEIAKKKAKHDFDTIYQIYKKHKETGIGYCSLAPEYNVNKWTIYKYLDKYKKELKQRYQNEN